VDPVRDPLLFIKCGSAGNRTRTSGFVARNSDHTGGLREKKIGMCGWKVNIEIGLKEMGVKVWRELLVEFIADVMVIVSVDWRTISAWISKR
jgi:hypothetical protein